MPLNTLKIKLKIDLIDNDEEVLIKISDDGPGFPQDILKVIGEPYISSKSPGFRSKSGSGIRNFYW